MTKNLRTITIGQLRHDLQKLLSYPDETLITFGTGNLSLASIKPTNYVSRDPVVPSTVNFEFAQDYQLTYDPEA